MSMTQRGLEQQSKWQVFSMFAADNDAVGMKVKTAKIFVRHMR
jgi:hypothetical protein